MVLLEAPVSMTYKIKDLLLRAWRERWSEIEFGRNIKRVLPRGQSGDIYDLADCILHQAITGPVPNALMISYLNHCLCARVISYSMVVIAITKIQDPKPNCTFCLLDFIHKHKNAIFVTGENADDCLALSKSLVALIHWLYQIASSSITSSATTPDDVNHQIIKLTSEMLEHISNSPFLKALLYIGKMEEPALWAQWCHLYREASAKLAIINQDKSYENIHVIHNFQQSVEWINAAMQPSVPHMPTISVAVKQLKANSLYIPYQPVAYQCLQATISFGAALDPASSVEVITGQIIVLSRFFDISLSQIYCESLHTCLVCLIDAHKLNENCKQKYGDYYHSWVAFFLIKIPQIFLRLSRQKSSTNGPSAPNELEHALELLLKKETLFEMFYAHHSLEHFQRLLSDFEKSSLLPNKAAERFLEKSRKIGKFSTNGSSAGEASSGTILVIRAEATIPSVLGSLTNTETETLMQVLCRVQKSLEVILCAAASTGILSKCAINLVSICEQSKFSNGENLRSSQLRAILFDVSFLSLCCLVQKYGTEVVTSNSEIKDSFVVKWLSLNLADRLLPDAILNSFSESNKLDSLLGQFIVSSPNAEFRTSLIRWNDMCVASQLATSEVLTAWTHDVLVVDAVKVFIERLKTRVCSLSVSATCWLFAQLSVASQEQSEKIISMLNELKNFATSSESISDCPAPDNTDLATVYYYKERSTLAQHIIKRLFDKYLPHFVAHQSPSCSPAHSKRSILPIVQTVPTPLLLSRKSINDLLKETIDSVQGHFSMKNIYDFDCLLSLGGAKWFTNNVVNFLFVTNETNEIIAHQLLHSVDLALGLFHLDLDNCALALMRHTVPQLIFSKAQQGLLSAPRITALIRLAIMTTFAALSQLKSLKECNLSRRSGHRRNYEEMPQDWQLGEIASDLLNDTPFIYEMQAEKGDNSKCSTNGSHTGSVPMEVDQVEHKEPLSALTGPGSELLKEPLYIEFIRFLNLLLSHSLDKDSTCRALVALSVLEQIVLYMREEAHQFLQFVPFHLLEAIVHDTYDILSFEQFLAYFCLDSAPARKTAAYMLCRLNAAKQHPV